MMNEQSRTIQGLLTAIQMEIEGKEFYLKASQSCQNKTGQTLFKVLADEEDLHRQRFIDIYRLVQETNRWPPVENISHITTQRKGIFAEEMSNIHITDSELSAVRTAMEMENKTRDFYQQQAAMALFEMEKKYYLALAGEEQSHHALLLDYFELLNDPGQYYTIKERHSLDGG
jgi:rubrerythrin